MFPETPVFTVAILNHQDRRHVVSGPWFRKGMAMRIHPVFVIAGLAPVLALVMSANRPLLIGGRAPAPGHGQPGRADDWVRRRTLRRRVPRVSHLLRSSTAGLDGNGRSCADCHMPTDQFPAVSGRCGGRFQTLQMRRRLESQGRRSAVPAHRRRRLPPQRRAASDFSNLRENGLVRIVFSLPPNMRLIDPATNLPSAETYGRRLARGAERQ